MRTDKIIEIVELDERETIDIEVSGNHLFLANGILTHNSNSDVGLEDTSESFGLPATADFMFALISTEELESLGQLMVKQLKNRWGDTNYLKRFVIGIDRSKMRLFDAELSAQEDIMDDTPMMDKGNVGRALESEREDTFVTGRKGKKPNFEGFR
jgi:hypothetical protein